MTDFAHVVVGGGLLGTAVARHLGDRTDGVALIGPDEPPRNEAHQGVFSSHYDQGRLTRLVGRDLVYSKIAELAIATYPEIEDRSGIRFHFPVGGLVVEMPRVDRGPTIPTMKMDPLEAARALGREVELFEPGDRSWRARFPALDFPETARVVYEPPPAGYINPRDLIRAQLALAERAGVTVQRHTVTGVSRRGRRFVVETDAGESHGADQVLVAAGAFAPFNRLLPKTLPFELETETVLLGRVSEEDFAALSETPTVVYAVDDPEIRDVYMTPPIRYPDGDPYVKIGGNTPYDLRPGTLEEVVDWFVAGDSDRAKPGLERVLRSLWPGVEFLSTETRRCILCRTPSGYPIIEEVEEGLFVAAGGNGGSAKGSDALGRFAARLVTEPGFDYLAYVRSLL